MKTNTDKDTSIVQNDEKNVQTNVANNNNTEHVNIAHKNKKKVYQKQHHDPNRTINKPYKFGIPGGPIFLQKKKVTQLIQMNSKSIKPIEVTMIGDHFVINKTAKKPQEPQKPSYLEALLRSEHKKSHVRHTRIKQSSSSQS